MPPTIHRKHGLWLCLAIACDSPSAAKPPPRVDRDLWAVVPAGEFRMGSALGEACREDDEAPVDARLTRRTLTSRHEVTRAQFRQALGYDPSFRRDCERCPVDSVTHHEAALYCNHVSQREALETCYSCEGERDALRCTERVSPAECRGYRLPTEAEWERASRGDSRAATHAGEIQTCMALDEVASRIAWYKANSAGLTHPVGSREKNAFGLYDMGGNVYEWTGDWYAPSRSGGDDPLGPKSGRRRVLRGGSWYHNAHHVRAAKRYSLPPEARLSYVGFRCVRRLFDD